MKLTDWIKTIILPLVEKPEDADLFLSASDLKAVEVTDDMVKAFNSKYLTRERALSDDGILKEVNRSARGLILDLVDTKLKKIIPLLTEEDQRTIAAESSSLNRLDLLANAIQNTSKNEDVKKVNETFRKKEEELHKKISEFETIIKEKDTNFAKERSGFKVDYHLRNKIAGLKLAPEFSSDEHKEFLAASTIDFLKKNYHLEFDESSSTVPLRKMVENAVTDVYEGNTKLTLDDVLKKKFEPYIEKNNAGGSDPKTHNPAPNTRTTIPTDQPVTLREMQRQGAPV